MALGNSSMSSISDMISQSRNLRAEGNHRVQFLIVSSLKPSTHVKAGPKHVSIMSKFKMPKSAAPGLATESKGKGTGLKDIPRYQCLQSHHVTWHLSGRGPQGPGRRDQRAQRELAGHPDKLAMRWSCDFHTFQLWHVEVSIVKMFE